MSRLVLLTDRAPERALSALSGLPLDVKVEPLSVEAVGRLPDLQPQVIVVDGSEDPATAHSLLEVLSGTEATVPLVAVVDPRDLERYPWGERADGLLYPSAPPVEVAV